jgi:sec-independent protein translocase protein TatB
MFDFSWSEIMVIALVALVLIGPKDLPVAIRAITRVLKKMRRMAGEFQHHVDDMMRDADLGDVQSTFRDLRSMNLKGAINSMVDPDGSVGRAFADPFADHPVPSGGSGPRDAPAPAGPAPAFIPPGAPPPRVIDPAPVLPVRAAPDFVPPGVQSPEAAHTATAADAP